MKIKMENQARDLLQVGKEIQSFQEDQNHLCKKKQQKSLQTKNQTCSWCWNISLNSLVIAGRFTEILGKTAAVGTINWTRQKDEGLNHKPFWCVLHGKDGSQRSFHKSHWSFSIFITTGKLKLNLEVVLGTELISLNPVKFVEPGTSNTGFEFILSLVSLWRSSIFLHPCRKTNHWTSYNKVLSDTDPAELCSVKGRLFYVFASGKSFLMYHLLFKPRAVTWITAMVRPWLCLFCKVLLVSQIEGIRSKGHSYLQNTFCSS